MRGLKDMFGWLISGDRLMLILKTLKYKLWAKRGGIYLWGYSCFKYFSYFKYNLKYKYKENIIYHLPSIDAEEWMQYSIQSLGEQDYTHTRNQLTPTTDLTDYRIPTG